MKSTAIVRPTTAPLIATFPISRSLQVRFVFGTKLYRTILAGALAGVNLYLRVRVPRAT
jgi:hypothetical protein